MNHDVALHSHGIISPHPLFLLIPYVCALDVPVDHAIRMQVGEPSRDLA